MRQIVVGIGIALASSTAAMAATKDATTQVVVACKCLDKYSQWMCEVFWWALC